MYALPRPRFNTTVAGHQVDVHWPQWNLVVELKSKRFHLTPKAMEIDAQRDTDLQRAHQRVIQVTWKRLHQTPHELLADIEGFAND